MEDNKAKRPAQAHAWTTTTTTRTGLNKLTLEFDLSEERSEMMTHVKATDLWLVVYDLINQTRKDKTVSSDQLWEIINYHNVAELFE